MRSLEAKRRYKQKKKASLASSPAPSEQSVIDTDSEINANVIDHNIDVSDTVIDIIVPVAGPSEPRLPDEAQQLIEFHDIPSSQQLIEFQEFTSTIFTKLHDISEELKGSSTPLSGNLGHDRRFSTASSSDKPRPNPTYVQVSEEVGHPSPSEGLRFVSQPVPGSGVARAVLCGEERATDLQNQKTRFQAIKNRISSTRQAIAVFRNMGQDTPGSLVDSLTSLYKDLEQTSLRSPPSPRGRHQPSDAPRLHRSPRSPRSHANRQRHHTPEASAAGPSGYLGRPNEQFASRPQVASFASFAQPAPSSEDGSPQRKKRRLSSGESSADEEEVSTPSKSLHHSRDDEDQDDPSHASRIGNMLAYIMDKFPSASAPLAQPSAKPFSVLASAGLAEESSDHASLLAWYEAIQSVCDVSQQRYETRIRDGKSWSTVLPSVSRFERVSNSPSQGRELKVNSPVFDLLRSKLSDRRSMPISLREGAVLERSLRGSLESLSFLLWAITALFRYFGDLGHIPKGDPLFDQFQRSISKVSENIASAISSSAAFVTLKRRETYLSHVVPSVTEAQKRKLLSDPLFNTRDLFSTSSLDAARQAARDVSLYKPHLQPKPSISPISSQKRPWSSGFKPQSKPSSSSAPPQRSSPPRYKKNPQVFKKFSDPLRRRGGFRK